MSPSKVDFRDSHIFVIRRLYGSAYSYGSVPSIIHSKPRLEVFYVIQIPATERFRVSCEGELKLSVSRGPDFDESIMNTYGQVLELEYSFHIWSLGLVRCAGYAKVEDQQIPPGAVGGRYGSGCFHFSNRSSAS